MGIFCQMNLVKPSDGIYHPGQVVSGVIRYTLDEPMDVDRITTSLKGIGSILLTDNPGSRYERNYDTKVAYIDIDTIVQDKRMELPVGTYEINFRYILPEQKLPSTMSFKGYFSSYKVKCSIKYYVRIKFERPGFLVFNKRFKTNIDIVSCVAPKLSIMPVIYGHTKKFVRLFSSKNSIVTIKATIQNSALPFCGRILVQYEVVNNSHIVVKSVMTKLVQKLTFKAKGHHRVTYEEDVAGTVSKTSPIKSGGSQVMCIDVNVSPQIYTVENAFVVCRHYAIRIIAELPVPHSNALLDIPVQIGVEDENLQRNWLEWASEGVSYSDAPPSYWEAMGEAKKADDDATDDELDNEK